MQVNTVVVHVEINIILRDSINSNIHGQLQNIKNTSLKFKKIGVKNIFISGLVYKTRINMLLWKKIHVMVQNFLPEIRLVLCR